MEECSRGGSRGGAPGLCATRYGRRWWRRHAPSMRLQGVDSPLQLYVAGCAPRRTAVPVGLKRQANVLSRRGAHQNYTSSV